jgi:hypothetical protein
LPIDEEVKQESLSEMWSRTFKPIVTSDDGDNDTDNGKGTDKGGSNHNNRRNNMGMDNNSMDSTGMCNNMVQDGVADGIPYRLLFLEKN